MADTNTLEKKRKTYPAVCDIYENDGKVICKLEMPGVGRENLDIKVDGDKLIINGRKTTAPLKGEYRVHEIREGDYYHEFAIDDTIDRNKIDAAIKNGVVTLTLGIKEAEKPRKINVVAN
jgi:HSP20 family protein